MRKILAIITFLLFLLLLWCTKERYNECCGDNTGINDNVVTETEEKTKIQKDGPLVYSWNSNDAITNDLWQAKKEAILSGKADGKILQILGPYFKDEGKEVGLSRAKSVLNLLNGQVDTSKVELGTKLIDFYDKAKSNKFAHTDFNWLVRNENIQEVDNKALIYFPTNSTKKISNVNIVSYLKEVAKSLVNNDKKVTLSGHTDNVGNPGSNKRLALGRANSIKSELVRLGVASNRISTVSYGETKPIAPNTTKEGRQKNRRVELEIK